MTEEEKVIEAIDIIKTYITNTPMGKIGLHYAEVEIVRFELDKVVERLGSK